MTEHGLPLAEYLAGELDAAQNAAVDQHLVTCDPCWTEVHVARLGQVAAQRTTELASDELRRRVLTQLAAAAPDAVPARRRLWHVRPTTPAPPRRFPQLRTSVATVLVTAAAFTIGLLVGHTSPAPPSAAPPGAASAHAAPTSAPTMGTLAAALSYYRLAMLPGTGIATAPAPDLRPLGLRVAGASDGTLATQPVTAYAYCDQAGARQIYVFLSATPFQALAPAGSATSATHTVRGYTVFSATPHPMIVVGRNHQLVDQVASRLS